MNKNFVIPNWPLEQTIDDFKEGFEPALEALVHAEAATLPMFALVDDLDRCRPNFAIELLEGIKYLFGINGVCFVVATKMAQLSESAKAIYGANFDGYSYLKRFLNVEYALPPCKNLDYMRLLPGEYPELGSYDLELGLPTQEFVGSKEEKDACFVLTWVADSFNLDLRSQRTVLEMIVASAAGVPKGKKVHLIWLAALCALRDKNSAGFEAVSLAGSSKGGWENANISEINKTIRMPGGGYEEQTKAVSLRDIAWLYYGVKDLDLKKIKNDYADVNFYDYPGCLMGRLSNELPNPCTINKPYPPSISSYFDLVKTAGHFVGGVGVGVRDSAIGDGYRRVSNGSFNALSRHSVTTGEACHRQEN